MRDPGDAKQPPSDLGSEFSRSCAALAIPSSLGLFLGGYYGLREWQAAIDEANQEGLTADYLPAGVMIWGFLGAFVGLAIGMSFLLVPLIVETIRLGRRARGE